ncbi:DMT family transporter [Photorhabdus heterorhabditis]|uniref:DMT family transporter n=1 Tax=Photorhabdus heterorhabditis TaxID=880156 RepID=UPI001561B57C|nr:DMT family transporter [Photorhabdus heterorhabditis]NRN27946.1 DMT family transporter [Photorhabdus heterorhabditis subsp. aluminescens]
MTRNKKVLSSAILIAMLWGGGFPISKIAIEQIGVWPFRFYSTITSVLILIFLVLILYKKKPNFYDLLFCIPLGILNVFLVPVLNNISLKYTDSVKASVLIYTMPAITSFLTMISSRRISFRSITVSILCILGVLIFISLKEISFGECIILVSAFAWALGTFLSEKIPTQLDIFSKVLYQNIVSFLLMIIITPFLSTNLNIFNFNGEFFQAVTHIFIPILYMGIASGVLVYILWFYMIERGGAELTAYSALISPIFSVLISYYFLNESITRNMFIGMLFIFSSVIIAFIGKKK